MTTFESSIRQIPFPQQNVYDKLSDLNNLQKLKERYELMKDNMPEEARKQAEKIKDLEFDQDSLSVNVPPVGSIKLRVVNREEPKCIKFETEQPYPVQFLDSASARYIYFMQDETHHQGRTQYVHQADGEETSAGRHREDCRRASDDSV